MVSFSLVSAIGAVLVASVVAPLAFIVYLVARWQKLDKLAGVAVCVLCWSTLSVFLPSAAARHGLIRKKACRWLLTLVSPAAIVSYAFWAIVIGMATSPTCKTLPYEELLATSHEDMVAITGLDDFPEFEYLSNHKDNWEGVVNVQYHFNDFREVERFTAKVNSQLKSKENLFWSVDTLEDDEAIALYGSNIVYTLYRGWGDTLYVDSPKGVKADCTQVWLSIGCEAFTMRYSACYPWNLEFYSSPDSLSSLTGVAFPDYAIVNCRYYDYFIDDSWEATLELAQKPSSTFIQSLKASPQWERLGDGRYCFSSLDRGGHDLWENIYVDPTSRFVTLDVSTH